MKPGKIIREPRLRLWGLDNPRTTSSRRLRHCFSGLMLGISLLVAARPCVFAVSLVDDKESTGEEAPAGPAQGKVPKAGVEGDREELPEDKAQREAAAAVDRLQRAIEGMRSAQQRITGNDTSSKTQALQEGVIKDLEQLLARLQQQQRNSQSRQRKPSDSDPSGGKQKPPPGQDDPQGGGGKPDRQKKDGSSGSQRNDGKSPDSEERTDQARKVAAEQARRQELVKDVWGHLPPHLREAMQNSFSEKYLPKYDELVKKYYESLAEKNRNRNRP